jgi:hypothetical protein
MKVYDINQDIDHDIDHDIDYDIIANPPAMSDGKSHSFGYGISKRFQCENALLHRRAWQMREAG